MSRKAKITNTQDLRELLIETIHEVRSGKTDAKQAGAISALSARVLQSARLDFDVIKHSQRQNKKTVSNKSTVLIG